MPRKFRNSSNSKLYRDRIGTAQGVVPRSRAKDSGSTVSAQLIAHLAVQLATQLQRVILLMQLTGELAAKSSAQHCLEAHISIFELCERLERAFEVGNLSLGRIPNFKHSPNLFNILLRISPVK